MLSKTLPDMSKFTDEQLVQIVRDSSTAGGIAPSLALSELQRRKQLRAGANRPPAASMAQMAAPVQQFQVGGGVGAIPADMPPPFNPMGGPAAIPVGPNGGPPVAPQSSWLDNMLRDARAAEDARQRERRAQIDARRAREAEEARLQRGGGGAPSPQGAKNGAPPEKKAPALEMRDTPPARAGLGMAMPPRTLYADHFKMVREAVGDFDGEAPKQLTPEELQASADAWSKRYGTDYSKYEGGLTKRRSEMGDKEERAFKAGLLAAFGRGLQGGPTRGAAWGSGIISGLQAADTSRDKFNRESRDIDSEMLGIAKARAAEGRSFGDMALRMETENRGARRDYDTAKRNWNKDTGLTALGILKSEEQERRAAARAAAGAGAGGEKFGKPDTKMLERADAQAEMDPSVVKARELLKTAPEALKQQAYEAYRRAHMASVQNYLNDYGGAAQYGTRTQRAGDGGAMYLPNKK